MLKVKKKLKEAFNLSESASADRKRLLFLLFIFGREEHIRYMISVISKPPIKGTGQHFRAGQFEKISCRAESLEPLQDLGKSFLT
jgi:hypothetical protein